MNAVCKVLILYTLLQTRLRRRKFQSNNRARTLLSRPILPRDETNLNQGSPPSTVHSQQSGAKSRPQPLEEVSSSTTRQLSYGSEELESQDFPARPLHSVLQRQSAVSNSSSQVPSIGIPSLSPRGQSAESAGRQRFRQETPVASPSSHAGAGGAVRPPTPLLGASPSALQRKGQRIQAGSQTPRAGLSPAPKTSSNAIEEKTEVEEVGLQPQFNSPSASKAVRSSASGMLRSD